MANVYGPKIVRDGLVLYLDKYNERSYLGEPTTNLVHYTNLDAGWSKGYNTNIVWNGIDPPDGIDSPVVGFNDIGTDDAGYWYSYGDHCPQNPSTQYTVSIYVKTTTTSTVNMNCYTADNSEAGRYWGYYNAFSASDGWKRLEWTFTSASNAESDSLSFYWYGMAEKLWLCAPQMEANPHATKFIPSANNGTTTTRSATDGWRDLSGGGNHLSLNKLAYDSTNVPGTHNNDFSFDGADDYAQNISNLNTIDDIFASGGTIEMAVNSTDGEGNLLVKFHPTGWYCQLHSPSGGNTRFRLDHDFDGATNGSWRTGHVIPVGEYTFITATYNRDSTSNDAVIYINGISTTVSELITPAGTAESDAGDRLTIGKNAWSDVTYFEGEIDIVRLYNRTLSAAEVLQNFNAHKGRYGL